MSAFNLAESIARAEVRLRPGQRHARSDRGKSRLPRVIEAELARLLATRERPSMSDVAGALTAVAEREAVPAPSRATLYNALERQPVPNCNWLELPTDVRASLYNLDAPEGSSAPPVTVPGDHVVFYAFNYGSPRAMSFASGLPWLCLWHALRRRGWRPKSRALLASVAKFRGI
jgi:hypothetical protein